jgi:DNA-binding CsgD family transcriptional regulator
MAEAVAGGFVGRAEELARLLAALERAEHGTPQVVLVAGDAGVGKTRLLSRFSDRAKQGGVCVLAGGSVELGDIGLAYLPIVDALAGLAEQPADAELLAEVAETTPGLGRLLPGIGVVRPAGAAEVGDGLEQLWVFEAVRTLLVRRSERSPVVVVVEDLHWADRATRDLISYLARTLRSGRVLLVGSYRSEGLDRRHPLRVLVAELRRLPAVEQLEVGPLGRVEVAEQLGALSGGPLPLEWVERIYRRCEGNPFYAEQLLVAGAGPREVALPSTLAELLLVRVEALSQQAQHVVRTVAVAGHAVSHDQLARLTEHLEPDLEGALREAVHAGVLIVDQEIDVYRLRHALLREAVYGDLVPGERVRLHAAYARLLADDSAAAAAAELAYHCLASHDLTGAMTASLRAAEEANAISAPVEALRHLNQAIALWGQVPNPSELCGSDRIGLVLRAAETAGVAGDQPQAVALARDAVAIVDVVAAPLRAAEVHGELGWHLHQLGRFEEALQVRMQAVALVPAQRPTRLRAQVSAAAAQALAVASRQDEARRWSNEALSIAQALGDAEVEADALTTLGLIESSGDPAKAHALFTAARQRALGVADRHVELRAIYNLAGLEERLGHLAAACGLADEGAALAAGAGLGWSGLGLELRREQCRLHYIIGAWDTSEQLVAAIPDFVITYPVARLAAAGLAVQVGRGRPAAEVRLGQLRSLAGRDPFLDIEVASWEAEFARWRGELDRAGSAIERALALIAEDMARADQPWFMAWIGLEALTVAADRAEQARAAGATSTLNETLTAGHRLIGQVRAAVEQTSQIAPAKELSAWLAKAEAEWTRLQGDVDVTRWQTAVEACDYGCMYEVACCQWRLAEALLGTGDRAQTTAAAMAAYQTAVRLDAQPLQGALEGLARRGRLNLGVSAPPPRGDGGLTPRELEVLALLAEGRSNRQIAEQLFISGKTASVHVTRILAKLGVHSRRDAAAQARKLGLIEPVDANRH